MPNFVGPADRPVAVIDIGSNSVRLVVYEGDDRASLPIFNEKILSGLGRDLDRTKCLPDEAMESALRALRRFSALTEAMGCARVDALATAAVREARNGADFIDRALNETGIEVRILSGEQEAQYAAYGVLSALPKADGLVGDLGGGSVEFVDLKAGTLGSRTSLPLGPVRFDLKDRLSPIRVQDRIDAALSSAPWIKEGAGRHFYAVGGAWRSLARMHMAYIGYPLHIIHAYTIAYDDALEFTQFLSRLSPDTVGRSKGVSKRRIETLPFAGMLLNRILTKIEPQDVILSSYGLREGALFEHLSGATQKQDPLLSMCRGFIAKQRANAVDGEAVAAWLAPVFHGETRERARLRNAACLISDIARGEHPDYRAEHSLMRVLRFPFVGIDHAERAFMAIAVASRHAQISGGAPGMDAVSRLLSKEEISEARAIGLGIRLAHTLSGGVASLLRRTVLYQEEEGVVLKIPETVAPDLNGMAVQRRLTAFAKAFGKTSRIDLTS